MFVADTSCERCGEQLDESKAVWLELDSRTNLYHAPGAFPADGWSQGGFLFGSACAKAVLKAGGRLEPIRLRAKGVR